MTDSTNWAAVPVRVQELFVKYAAASKQLLAGEPNKPEGWVLDTEELGPVLIKRAINMHDATKGGFAQAGQAWRTAQQLLGGPNPLTSALLGGALAGGAGYGTGWILRKLFPQAFSDQTPIGFGLIGAAAGMAPGAVLHAPYALKNEGIKGLFKAQPLQGAPGPLERVLFKQGDDSRFKAVLEKTCNDFGVMPDDAAFAKHAQPSMAGGFLPKIPTDEWGRVVMRDPFLTEPEKAISAGLPAAAGAMRGSSMVSPRDVAHVAVNAGLGYGYGYLGSLAARFLGLPKAVQTGVQRAGLLAGAIRGVTGMGY